MVVMYLFKHFHLQCEVLNYLGLTSIRIDNGKSIGNKIFKKCCLATFFGLYVAMLICSTFQGFGHSKHTITVSHILIDIIESATELLFVTICISSPLIKMKNWKSFFDLMDKLETEQHKNDQKSTELFKIMLIYISLIAFFLFDIPWFPTSSFYWYYGTLAMNKLYHSSLVYIIYTINTITKHSLELLIEKLNGIQIRSNEEIVREIENNYLCVRKITDEFNIIFGWQIFFAVLTTVLIVLNVVNDTLYLRQTELTTPWEPQIFCDIASALVYMVSICN